MRYNRSERRGSTPSKGKKAAGKDAKATNGAGHEDWRDRRDEAQAKLAMLELQERDGSLMSVELHRRAMRAVASAVIAQFSSIPDRIAAEFGADDDERKRIRGRLVAELTALRANLARNGAIADA